MTGAPVAPAAPTAAEQPFGDLVGLASVGSHLDDAAADIGTADAGLDFRNHQVAQLIDRRLDRNAGKRVPVESGRAHDRDAGLCADPPQCDRIASPIGGAEVGDRRQAEFLGMAKIIHHRLLFRFADANGRPLLGGEIDLQVLMGENPALNGRDVSGHGSDHCLSPISRPEPSAMHWSWRARRHPSAKRSSVRSRAASSR
jgi:hypothetical protein